MLHLLITIEKKTHHNYCKNRKRERKKTILKKRI